MIAFILNDGHRIEGKSARDILTQLTALDWTFPQSVWEYKQGVSQRVELMGYFIAFWDYTSFLIGMSECGLGYFEWNQKSLTHGPTSQK